MHEEYTIWEQQGRPVPPPHGIKILVVREYGARFGLRTLIETGTFHGDMLHGVKYLFDPIYSIELDFHLHEAAKVQFAPYGNIKLLQGDSGEMLGPLLANLREPALFWLDGHYSGGITARGSRDTPIVQELEHIFRHPIKDHVLLIDDARCFVGQDDYPTIDELREIVHGYDRTLHFEVRNDIIRIHRHEPAISERTFQSMSQLLQLDGHRFVTEVYRQFLNREPEPEGLHIYAQLLAGGMPKLEIIASVLLSDESNYLLRSYPL